MERKTKRSQRKTKRSQGGEPVSKNEDSMLAADEMRNSAKHCLHQFTEVEIATFRSRLMDWYNQNGRDLPWRRLARNSEAQQKAYAVLVSEVMLQQTQVATVEQYYKKWMARWPTFEHLASASHEEVNEMWSGLGYYARGQRLFESAKKVMTDFGGKVPESSVQLQKTLPGVGRYTAGAVASIAFGERVPAVDGNVIRVLSRLRLIGGNSDSQVVVKDIWDIAETVVDTEQPGSFNEAMMDLGATVCTAKTPTCSSCPLNGICLSYKLTINEKAMKNLANKEYSLLPDIEIVPDCRLCLPPAEWDPSLGVKNFPRKSKKGPPKEENYVVAVLHRKMNVGEEEYFMVKRPKEGLLASLWEFPSFFVNLSTRPKLRTFLLENLETCHGVKSDHVESSSFRGEVKHIFSHLIHIYMVYDIKLTQEFSPLTSACYQDQQWVSEQEFPSVAMSKGVKKIFKIFISENTSKIAPGNCAVFPRSQRYTKKRRASVITDFFTAKNSESRFLNRQKPPAVLGIYSRPGKYYYLKVAFLFLILQLRKVQTHLQKQNKSQNSKKSGYGIKSRATIEEMDCPQTLSDHPKAIDAVYFNMASPKGWHLITGTATRPHGVVNGFLFIQVPGLGLLGTPKLPDTLMFRDETYKPEEYGAEGIRLVAFQPMRVWRLQYNGKMILHNHPEETFDVRLNAVWSSALPYFDFDTDMDALSVSKSMSVERWSRDYFSNLKNFHQTHYEQHGDMHGQLHINDRLYSFKMSGVRDHSYGEKREWKNFHRYVLHFITLEDGRRISVGVVSTPVTFSRVEIGYIYLSDGSLMPVAHCSLQLYQHGEKGSPPTDYSFIVTAGGQLYNIQVEVASSAEFFIGWEWETRIVEQFAQFTVNGVKGWGAAEWQYRHLDGRPATASQLDPVWTREVNKG